ncbi:MAG: divergent PAP2 family protein [Candidatus Margulisiibacteriota bacterium]
MINKHVHGLGDIVWLLLHNKALVAAIMASVVAQVLKLFTYYIQEHRINFRHLVTTGGMPSSHTAMVCALATSIGMLHGWKSSEFAIAFVFSSIVMYDAAGVRRAAGKQAKILNQIMDDVVNRGRITGGKLTELIGHTPLEVFAGAILGVLIAFIMF